MYSFRTLAVTLTLCFFFFCVQAQTGKVGIGTNSPGSLLHLYSTENTSSGLSIGSQGLNPNQQSYLELITLGEGMAKLGQPENIGWHLTARGGAYGGIDQQHDLLLSHWDGSSWQEMMFFDTTGNVGIGNTQPTSALEINGHLEFGLNDWSILKARSDIAQLSIQSSVTPFNGAYLLMNAGERPDDAGSIYITHGNFTAPAPESLIRFRYANDGVLSNQLVITSPGNIGIGTESPGSLLHLFNPQNTSRGISIGSSGLLPGQQSYLELITLGDGSSKLGQPENVGWHLTARGGAYGGVSQQHDLLLSHWNGSSWRNLMFFDTAGYIGIGTSSPTFPLEVETDTELRSGYFYNTTNSTMSTMGLYSGAHGGGSGAKRGGSFEAVGGSGVNTGVRAFAIDGSTNMGLYSSASGGATNWAGYFEDGNIYMKNRLGIGTTTPAFSLDVQTGTDLRAGYFYNSLNSTLTTYGVWGGAYGGGSGNKRGGGFEASGGSGENIGMRAIAVNGNSNIGVFGAASGGQSNWAGYFTDGNVYVKNNLGVGVSSPARKFHVSGGDMEINDGFPWIYLDATTSTGNSGIYFQNQNTTGASIVFNKNGKYLLLENLTNSRRIVLDDEGIGINTTTPGYQLHFIGNGVNDIAEFYNANTGSNADVLRAKVNNTTPATSQYFFRVVGGDGGSDGGVRADGSGGAYFATSSDRRLKKNIRNFTGALDILNQVQPRQYEMKQKPGFRQYGFIAQELAAVYPEAVAGDDTGDVNVEPMMIDYSRLTPLLAGATKELHEIIKEQRNEIELLKSELAEIRAMLEKE